MLGGGGTADPKFWEEMDACRKKLAAKEPPKEKVIPAHCTFEPHLEELEERIEDLVQAGETLKRLSLNELPEYPEFEYTLTSGGSELSVEVIGPLSYGQNLSDLSDTVVGVLGMVADLPPLYNLMDKDLSAWKATGFRTAILESIAFVKGELMKGRSSQGVPSKDIVEFVRSMANSVDNVATVRHGMICTVKTGMPKFYAAYDELKKLERLMADQVEANSECPSKYFDLLKTKMRPAEKIYQWHAEGITGPDKSSGWVKRHTWIDLRVTNDFRSAIIEEENCTGWEEETRRRIAKASEAGQCK